LISGSAPKQVAIYQIQKYRYIFPHLFIKFIHPHLCHGLAHISESDRTMLFYYLIVTGSYISNAKHHV
jgi:hypothetical protein